MITFIGIIIGILSLIFLIIIHELGHAITAKKSGVVVQEFGIGFPPRAKVLGKVKGVLVTLNWLPLGGFCQMQGEYDSAKKKGDYGAASYWNKTKILIGGIAINWFFAAFLFMVLALFGSMPKIFDNQFSIGSDTYTRTSNVTVTDVVSNSPAAKAGIKSGDELISFNGKSLINTSLASLTKDNAGKQVSIKIKRDGETFNKEVTLNPANSSSGYLGVAYGEGQYIGATWSAPLLGLGTAIQFTGETIAGVGSTLVNLYNGVIHQFSSDQTVKNQADKDISDASQNVAGPISIVGIIFPAASKGGPVQVIYLIAVISLTLAIMNMLPIPAMDGGRWLLMTIYKLIRKPLKESTEEKFQAVGMILILVLTVLVVWADITKL